MKNELKLAERADHDFINRLLKELMRHMMSGFLLVANPLKLPILLILVFGTRHNFLVCLRAKLIVLLLMP